MSFKKFYNFYKRVLQTEVKGNLIPKPASLSLSGAQELVGSGSVDATLRLKGNYGDDISFEYTDSAVVNIRDKSGEK